MYKDFSDTTIIIPTLNESATIGKLLNYLINEYRNIRIIVCDDGSQDGTRDIVGSFSGVRFLDRSAEKIHGLTASVLDGISLAATPYFVVIDGDCQHPPRKIRDIVELLRAGEHLVVGIRSEVPGWTYHRRMMSLIATWLGEAMLFVRGLRGCRDILSGFFGGDTAFFRDIIKQKKGSFELEGYKVLFDLLKVSPKNIKIADVEYVFQTRAGGESKMNSRIIWKYLKSILK
jgi:dolichol-phosphate mannosyltransferase